MYAALGKEKGNGPASAKASSGVLPHWYQSFLCFLTSNPFLIQVGQLFPAF